MYSSHRNMRVVFNILPAATLIILVTSCSEPITEDSCDPIQLTYRLMWNPARTDLPDWQLLGRWPQELIAGRTGELFLSDEQNARVLHFTVDGDLIGVIGRSGGGPGEFNNPVDLAYDHHRDVLWVGERGSGRSGKISRFTRNEDQFQFLDSFTARALMIDRMPSLATAVEEDRYWTNGWFFSYEEDVQNTLIQQIQTDGVIQKSFGEPWEPEWVTRGMISRINECFLIRIGDESLALVWQNQPRIQIWSIKGTLLVERYFDTPEIVRPGPGPVKNEEGREVFYYWFSNAAFCEPTGLLYAGFSVIDENRFDFYALDPASLLIAEWYQLPLSESDEDRIWPSRLVVEKSSRGITFYCIEMFNSGVLVIEPE